jgi:hypothetical protein
MTCFNISSCHFSRFYIKTCFNVNPLSIWLSHWLNYTHPVIFITKFRSQRKFITRLKMNELQFIMKRIFLHMNYWTSWLMIHKTQSLNPSLIILLTFHHTIQNFPPKYYLGCKFKTQVSHNKICYGHKNRPDLKQMWKTPERTQWKMFRESLNFIVFSEVLFGGGESCWQSNNIHYNLQLACWQSVHMKSVKPNRCYTMVYWTLWIAQHVSGIIMPETCWAIHKVQ